MDYQTHLEEQRKEGMRRLRKEKIVPQLSQVAVVHIFYDVYMGYQHNGLKEVMRKEARKVTLDKGEVALFINRRWNACKLLTGSGLLAYHRVPDQEIDVETIRYLPTQLGGEKLKFSKNLEANLIKAFEEHKPNQEAKTA